MGRMLGYGLHESTLLVTLQEGDFKEIFYDDFGYLPSAVIYDEKTPSHTIVFDNDHSRVAMTGTARFVETPSYITRRFRGEVQTHILKVEEMERAKVQNPEPITDIPHEVEKDSVQKNPEGSLSPQINVLDREKNLTN